MILKAYKVQLDVNNKQQTLLLQHIGHRSSQNRKKKEKEEVV